MSTVSGRGGAINNVGEYITSGLPFVTASSVSAGTVDQIDFPYATNEITVRNSGSGELRFGFTENGVQGENYFALGAAEKVTVNFRTKQLFLTADGGTAVYNVAAGLTQIPKKAFPILTGSAATRTSASYPGTFGYHPGLDV